MCCSCYHYRKNCSLIGGMFLSCMPHKKTSIDPYGAIMLFKMCDHFLKKIASQEHILNTLRPRQNGRHLYTTFWNENISISIKMSPKLVAQVRINNIPALLQIMARRLPGDKPLSETSMVSLLTHICIYASLGLSELTPFKQHFGV